ncbi:unnamed protein product [Prorocentrum cordatum]|uniref:Uncharacterized protein n=1 Tax=Prorocentrum cordatum TaxID=2364126 RepID=A0ABN9SAI2_9DINO|nr:unnamed protein product [Polarella glacialis]
MSPGSGERTSGFWNQLLAIYCWWGWRDASAASVDGAGGDGACPDLRRPVVFYSFLLPPDLDPSVVAHLGAGDVLRVRDFTPDAARRAIAGLEGRSRLLLDLTQGSFRETFDEAILRAGPEHAGLSLGALDCNMHMRWCDSALGGVELWTALRLFRAGDSPNEGIHIPTSAFTANDTEGNVGRLLAITSSTSRGVQLLAQVWRKEAVTQEASAAWAATDEGAVVVTDASFDSVLGRAHQPGHQVFILYHGSLDVCAQERAEMMNAFRGLHASAKEMVTVAVVNCDIHRIPCEAASLAKYSSQHSTWPPTPAGRRWARRARRCTGDRCWRRTSEQPCRPESRDQHRQRRQSWWGPVMSCRQGRSSQRVRSGFARGTSFGRLSRGASDIDL